MAIPISGIGGFFFRSKDPKAAGAWYEKYFGINSMQSGTIWMQQAGPTVFAPFREDTDYFGNPAQTCMLNFRVNDLDATLEMLRAEGVRIDDQRMEESFGKFAWIYDLDGNRVELWQPVEDTGAGNQ